MTWWSELTNWNATLPDKFAITVVSVIFTRAEVTDADGVGGRVVTRLVSQPRCT